MKKIILLLLTTISFTFAYNFEDVNMGSTYNYVPVDEVTRVYENVGKKVCTKANTNSIGLDTLIGGVAGVAIGNQIGKGSGRDTAKVVGGVGGALFVNNMRTNCKTVYEKVLRGYNHYFSINGVKYKKFSTNRLNSIKVTVKQSISF